MNLAWSWLVLAISTEIVSTLALRYTEGFTKPGWTALTLIGYAVSFYALAKSLTAGMEVGIAYAVWSAVGTAVVAGVGMYFWGEAVTAAKLACLGLIIVGVVGLNLAAPHA